MEEANVHPCEKRALVRYSDVKTTQYLVRYSINSTLLYSTAVVKPKPILPSSRGTHRQRIFHVKIGSSLSKAPTSCYRPYCYNSATTVTIHLPFVYRSVMSLEGVSSQTRPPGGACSCCGFDICVCLQQQRHASIIHLRFVSSFFFGLLATVRILFELEKLYLYATN